VETESKQALALRQKQTIARLIRGGDPASALSDARARATEYPSNLDEQFYCAQVALVCNDAELAASCLSRIRLLAPEAYEGTLITAHLARWAGELAHAEMLLTTGSKHFRLTPSQECRRLQQLGLTLADAGRYSDATKTLRRAAGIRPTDVQLLCELSHVLDMAGNLDEALVVIRRALRLEPDHPLALRNAASFEANVGRNEEAFRLASRAREIAPTDPGVLAGWLLDATSSPDVDAQTLTSYHAAATARLGGQTLRVWPATTHPELRVGYFSHHFKRFPLCSFVPHVLRSHNRKKVRVFALSLTPKLDSWSKNYVDAVDEFHDFSTLSDAEAVDRARELELDVVVDLSGLTDGNRFAILAARIAPIQCSWLGYLTSTGSAAMDYHITDIHSNPPGATEDIYTEKFVRLAAGQYCYQPMVANLPVPTAPQPNQEPRSTLRLGLFSAATKLNKRTLHCVAQVMLRVPFARLYALAPSDEQRQHVLAELRNAGVNSGRVEFFGKLDLYQYFCKLGEMDVLLDSFPFVGGTVVCDALWMGVPTVSMWLPRGFSGASRSVLSCAGLGDLVATNEDQYIDIATALANDEPRRIRIRESMRREISSTPLGQPSAMADQLERGYAEIVARYRSGQLPDHLTVTAYPGV
jgi:protein O-GlcNAc transferase